MSVVNPCRLGLLAPLMSQTFGSVPVSWFSQTIGVPQEAACAMLPAVVTAELATASNDERRAAVSRNRGINRAVILTSEGTRRNQAGQGFGGMVSNIRALRNGRCMTGEPKAPGPLMGQVSQASVRH